LLIRNAFVNSTTEAWPLWEELLSLACYPEKEEENVDCCDSGESARLIRHKPGHLDSFSLELGPFPRELLQDAMMSESERWTIVVNDVDRYMPSLDQWMNDNFDFLPRWRRDDAQISLAGKEGGIGPHVDNYDVFLIQTSGSRTWQVGLKPMTVHSEMDALIPDIPVRILDLDDDSSHDSCRFSKVTVHPGDLLYLPPRFVHCGTALSDDCMTLSVGCRAPSATEMLARVAESVQMSATEAATRHFTDNNLLEKPKNGDDASLASSMKASMKRLVLDAVEEILEDELKWDELVGKLVTEPIRYSGNAMPPHDERIRLEPGYSDKWGVSPPNVLKQVMQNKSRSILLVRAAGVSVATSSVTTKERGRAERLFTNGDMWEVWNDLTARSIFCRIERGKALGGTELSNASPGMLEMIEDLIREGLLQPSCEGAGNV
jgi:50S ribosomal protein L16 3-hydroxylase